MAQSKRKRDGSADPTGDRQAQRGKLSVEADNNEVLTAFNAFEDALCDLLSVASAVTDLNEVLGDQKANFISALQSMVEVGDLPWVSEVDSGVEESEPESESPEIMFVSSPTMEPLISIRVASHFEPAYSCAQLANELAAGMEILTNLDEIYHGSPPSSQSREILATISGVPFTEHRWPPPLPVIQNESLRRQALTLDTSINCCQPSAHYQRLEFLGDAYLEIVVTRILFDRFPAIREGHLTQMRANMVRNCVLANFGAIYKFREMIESYGHSLLVNWKVLADCFEAYIAAVALSDPVNGFETLIHWLTELYEPRLHGLEAKPYLNRRKNLHTNRLGAIGIRRTQRLVSDPANRVWSRLPLPIDTRASRTRVIQYPTGPPIIIEDSDPEDENWEEIPIGGKDNQNSAGVPIDKDAKDKLEKLITAEGVSLDYEWMGGPDGIDSVEGVDDDLESWKVTIMLTGLGFVKRPIGTGWGANESEAGLRAAMNVMLDKAFCAEILKKHKKSEYSSQPTKAGAPVMEGKAPNNYTLQPPWEEMEGVITILDD